MHSIEFFNHSKRNKILEVTGCVQHGLAHSASYAKMALLVLILHRNSNI